MNGTARILPTPVLPAKPLFPSPTTQATGLIFLAPFLFCAYLLRWRLGRQRKRVPSFSTSDPPEKPTGLLQGVAVAVANDTADAPDTITPYIDHFPKLDRLAEDSSEVEREQMVKDKELYWRLQNVEDHPGECAG